MTLSTIRTLMPPLRSGSRLAIMLLLTGTMIASASAGESSFQHRYVMRGQVLEAEAGNVVVCVGKEDGAEVGQVLDVVRHVRTAARGKSIAPRYRRDDVGAVKIISLFDGHYATAKVIKGAPKVNDSVELEQ